jgi:hypothetical protein
MHFFTLTSYLQVYPYICFGLLKDHHQGVHLMMGPSSMELRIQLFNCGELKTQDFK